MCGQTAVHMQYTLFINILYPIQLVFPCDLDKLQRFDSHICFHGFLCVFQVSQNALYDFPFMHEV